MLYILLWSIFSMSKIEAQSQSSASGVAVSVYQVQEPSHPNPVVEKLALSLSEGLLHSPVFGDFSNFVIYQPYDSFFKLSMSFLVRAGVNDTSLAKHVANAVKEIGVVTSQLYFRTAGYNMATVLFEQGIATMDNVNILSLSIVSAIGVVACVDGLSDAESVILAVVYGFSDVMDAYGIVDYDNMAYLFYHFAGEIKVLAGVNGR